MCIRDRARRGGGACAHLRRDDAEGLLRGTRGHRVDGAATGGLLQQLCAPRVERVARHVAPQQRAWV
eukprot:4792912-Prymnesium_polylepis.1